MGLIAAAHRRDDTCSKLSGRTSAVARVSVTMWSM
jgi:hypothetical protein